MDGGVEAANLKYTPTWVVAAACIVIVAISLFVGLILSAVHRLLKWWDKTSTGFWFLLEALKKVKEELMMLGFISLLLTVFQEDISDICIPKDLARHMLPCKLQEDLAESTDNGSSSQISYCAQKNKVPLLSMKALHHLHIFIFVIGIVHVTFCVLTIGLSWKRTLRWRHWEEEIAKQKVVESKECTCVRLPRGSGKKRAFQRWLYSFVKLFWGSMTRSEYMTLRRAFIEIHVKENQENFNFHIYLMHVLKDDFKELFGIRWYLWIFVSIFLLLNVHGWLTSFWMSFIPLILLFAVGIKLEHVVTQLALEVDEKPKAVKLGIVLSLIHFILFENTFEIAFFFWIWVQYSFNSCVMGGVRFVIVRLIIGVFIQVYCSWCTLPLCAIVTQMEENSLRKGVLKHLQVDCHCEDCKTAIRMKSFSRLEKNPSKANMLTLDNHHDANERKVENDSKGDLEALFDTTRPEEASS